MCFHTKLSFLGLFVSGLVWIYSGLSLSLCKTNLLSPHTHALKNSADVKGPFVNQIKLKNEDQITNFLT